MEVQRTGKISEKRLPHPNVTLQRGLERYETEVLHDDLTTLGRKPRKLSQVSHGELESCCLRTESGC